LPFEALPSAALAILPSIIGQACMPGLASAFGAGLGASAASAG
jgi:hypothetical protein